MSLQSTFEDVLATEDPIGQLDPWIWDALNQGALSNEHPWNAGYFSTVEVDDSGAIAPRTRTVIVRNVDPQHRVLDFFTDVRSTKVEQLRFESGNSEVCWLFYDPVTKIQLRLEGTAQLIAGEIAAEAWERTPVQSRAAYLSIATPGLDKPGVQPPDTSDRIVSQEESERGRDNFRVVRTNVRVADLLYLRRAGHVRSRSEYQDLPEVSCKWVVP